MKKTIYIMTILILILTSSTSYSQTKDTLDQTSTSPHKDTITTEIHTPGIDQIDNDFAPGIFLFVFGVVFVSIFVGVGLLLTALGLLIIFGLVSFGILSTSIIVGINNRSFAKGFKTFIVLTSTIGGLVLCSLGIWLLNKTVHWWTPQTAIINGAVCGLVAGSTFGLFTFYISQRFSTYFKQRLNLTTWGEREWQQPTRVLQNTGDRISP